MKNIVETIAITGMNATDNPAPGVAVARSLRQAPGFDGKLLGLGYDALDPGFHDIHVTFPGGAWQRLRVEVI